MDTEKGKNQREDCQLPNVEIYWFIWVDYVKRQEILTIQEEDHHIQNYIDVVKLNSSQFEPQCFCWNFAPVPH